MNALARDFNSLNSHNEEKNLFVTFKIKSSQSELAGALNIHKVKEVIEVKDLSPLPADSFPFIAMVDLRGVPIPLFSLDAIFSKSQFQLADTKDHRILFIEIQSITIALLVSGKQVLKSFANSSVLAPPEGLTNSKLKFFNGIIKDEEKFLYLIDIESILAHFGFSFDKISNSSEIKKGFANLNILLVEDSRLYQKTLLKIFQKWGCKVTVAENGMEGINILNSKKYSFDLIFCDIEMPVMNGIEMITKVKGMKDFKHIPVVFNSSLSNPALMQEVIDKKLGQYIIKLDEDIIYSELEKLFGGSAGTKGVYE